jgi:hypothetical protein
MDLNIERLLEALNDDQPQTPSSVPDRDLYGDLPPVCVDAARQLASLGEVRAVPGLIRLLESKSFDAREAAVIALRQLNAREAQDRLVRLTHEDPAAGIRLEAIQTLSSWGVEVPGARERRALAERLTHGKANASLILGELEKLAHAHPKEQLLAASELLAAVRGLLRETDMACAVKALQLLAECSMGDPHECLDLLRPEARKERRLSGPTPASELQRAALRCYASLGRATLPWRETSSTFVPLMSHSDGFTRTLVRDWVSRACNEPEARAALEAAKKARPK